MSTQTVLFVSCCLLLMLFGNSKSSSNRRCLPLYGGYSFCFTQPDPPVALSWYEAQRWCKNINATLPMPNTSYIGGVYDNALGYFGLQAETLWLAANATYDPYNWFWTDGSHFTGTVEDGNAPGKTHAYVILNDTDLKFVAAHPSERHTYISQVAYSEITCAQSSSTLWANGRCFYKYSWQLEMWYSFMYECRQSHIPSYDDLKDLTRWLDKSTKYWVGLRCGWWSWSDFVTGKSLEIIDFEMGKNLPNASSGQCLAGNWTSKDSTKPNWINVNCDRPLQFICQQRVVTPQKQTTASPYWPPSYGYSYRATVHHPLAIGLGVGLGALFLALTACALLALYRRKRDSRYSAVSLRKLCEYCKPRITWKNSYSNYAFKAASGTVERHGTHYKYQPINPAANEYVY